MSLHGSLPLVSVAIISYNHKKFLLECINSILEQDYGNIEIVVADDGSTDGSQELLTDLAASENSNFVLRLSSENRGITRNSSIAHRACSGKYIAWMGGDDLMLPGKIRRQVEYLEAHPECNVLYHDLDVFDSESSRTLYLFSERNQPRFGKCDVIARYGTFNGACSTMVRRSAASEDAFSQMIPLASDWMYWFQCVARGGEIHYLDQVLGRYRRHRSSVTQVDSLALQLGTDHLVSSVLILAKHPELASQIKMRMCDILIGMRCLGKRKYLLASFVISPWAFFLAHVKCLMRVVSRICSQIL